VSVDLPDIRELSEKEAAARLNCHLSRDMRGVDNRQYPPIRSHTQRLTTALVAALMRN